MKKKFSPPPLRLTLVLIVFILALAHLILDKGFELAIEQPLRAEKHQIDAARQLIDKVRQNLNSDRVHAELRIAEQIISIQGLDPDVSVLAVMDPGGDVVVAGNHARETRPDDHLITGYDPVAYRKAVAQQRTIIEKSGSGDSLHVYAPLSLPDSIGASGPGQPGGLYLRYDLERAKSNARSEILALENWLSWGLATALSAALIVYLLNHWVAQPLRRIGRAVSRAARGDMGVVTGLEGSSEIALLGRGVDRMSREIDASKSALNQASLDLERRVEERTQHLEREIQYRRNLERALRSHERQMQTVFNTVSEGIALWDAEGRLVYANPGFRKLLGMGRSADRVEFEEKSLVISDENGNPLPLEEFPILKTLADMQPREGSVVGIERPDSGQRWVKINVIPVTDEKGAAVTGIVSSVSDITDLKYHEKQLDRMANFDALTGLPNRRLLHDRMQQLVEQVRRKGGILAVCYLDLDGFKYINDKYGHKAGDGLLVEAASRFVHCVRAADTVARLGGDEFVVLLSDIEDKSECEVVLGRILSSLSDPYTVAGKTEGGITVSAGVTLFPADNRDPDTLIRHADQAMYAAKRSGKNRVNWFDPGLGQRTPARNDALTDLSRALTERELVLHYQPRIRCRDNAFVGAEALLRWQHPVRGMLSPAQFIPLVEEHDLALDIGRYVIQEALRQCQAWSRRGASVPVSVNIFARQLQQPDFADALERSVKGIGRKGRISLDLEILESAALEGIRDFPALVRRCEAFGVTFSLDDFGTGYSTLDHLRRIPAQSLKIDRSFVHNLQTSREDRTLIEAAIGLGHAFGRRITAEGVENQAQLRWLKAAGCDDIQGFLFARPMKPAAFMRWLRQYRPDAA